MQENNSGCFFSEHGVYKFKKLGFFTIFCRVHNLLPHQPACLFFYNCVHFFLKLHWAVQTATWKMTML